MHENTKSSDKVDPFNYKSLCLCKRSRSNIQRREKTTFPSVNKLTFQEYSFEYFRYANTPQEFIQDTLKRKNPRILEIGSGKGEFLLALLAEAEEHEKQLGVVCVEFAENNRNSLQSIMERYKENKLKHSLVLSFNSNVMDYIQRNPEKKRNFLTDIISSYSFHCLCPMDLLTLLRSCHSFTQQGGQLSLTLMNYESFEDNAEIVKDQISTALNKGDYFPGYNYNSQRTRERIQKFLEENLPYPTKNKGAKTTYIDPHMFAQDIAPLLPTVHEASWTKSLLKAFGYDVKICEDTIDLYPAHPLQAGEISNDCIETRYLKVKAIKGNTPINNDLISLYEKAAIEKEQRIFEDYKSIIN